MAKDRNLNIMAKLGPDIRNKWRQKFQFKSSNGLKDVMNQVKKFIHMDGQKTKHFRK